MSELRIKYQVNCKTSKTLCLQLEKLLDEADYYEKVQLYGSMEQTMYLISELKEELEKIWDKQIDLYFEIIDEYRKNNYTNKPSYLKVIEAYKPVNAKIAVLKYPINLPERAIHS